MSKFSCLYLLLLLFLKKLVDLKVAGEAEISFLVTKLVKKKLFSLGTALLLLLLLRLSNGNYFVIFVNSKINVSSVVLIQCKSMPNEYWESRVKDRLGYLDLFMWLHDRSDFLASQNASSLWHCNKNIPLIESFYIV